VAHLNWESRPALHQPIVIAAFEGWNDAGDAATHAIDYLVEHWAATGFASIDPEDFYDFTTTRPDVEIVDGDLHRICWPENRFHFSTDAGHTDVILVRGVEPQLKWRTFCSQVLDVAESVHARLVMTLGALLADVPHSRPTSVFGTSYDPHVIEALHLEPSTYEGPTGIVGVLHAECRQRGINSASLWAAVPSYVASAPSPKATLALVDRVSRMLGVSVSLDGLNLASTAYEEQINELVSEDPETLSYVKLLEEQHDRDESAVARVDQLVDEVERFLREQ
jgi:predicted ATP-grasp superfamily ATP-dependent carboligase